MSKRRMSQQQWIRIGKKHDQYRTSSVPPADKPLDEGLVITRFGNHAHIQNPAGEYFYCSIRPTLDSLVAGDRVVWQAEGEKQGVVVSRHTRQSVLGRPNKRGEIKPVAANITQVMIVVAAKPNITWPLLDSYLVLAEFLQLKACIVLNKIDLACKALQNDLLQHYAPLGYPILFTQADQHQSFHNLLQQLQNEVSVFVGQSGVGKSSLVAGILPQEVIQTKAISAFSELGCHTTSTSCFYQLPEEGALIDSPGVREFGLWHMPATSIAEGYREFKPYLGGCKFRNCNHHDTPGCAIIAAVEKGTITRFRYAHFIQLCKQFAKTR